MPLRVVAYTGTAVDDRWGNLSGLICVDGPTGIFVRRIRARGHEEFLRYDITEANLAYWSGLTTTHVVTLATRVPSTDAPHTGPFDDPRGVIVDRSGRIVIADIGNQRVVTVQLEIFRSFVPLVVNDAP